MAGTEDWMLTSLFTSLAWVALLILIANLTQGRLECSLKAMAIARPMALLLKDLMALTLLDSQFIAAAAMIFGILPIYCINENMLLQLSKNVHLGYCNYQYQAALESNVVFLYSCLLWRLMP